MEAAGGCTRPRTRALLRWVGAGSRAPGVSRRRPRLRMQWGERGPSWAPVEAAGSPGQRVEAVLEVRVVSGLGVGSTLHLLQTLQREIITIIRHSSELGCNLSHSFFFFSGSDVYLDKPLLEFL